MAWLFSSFIIYIKHAYKIAIKIYDERANSNDLMQNKAWFTLHSAALLWSRLSELCAWFSWFVHILRNFLYASYSFVCACPQIRSDFITTNITAGYQWNWILSEINLHKLHRINSTAIKEIWQSEYFGFYIVLKCADLIKCFAAEHIRVKVPECWM